MTVRRSAGGEAGAVAAMAGLLVLLSLMPWAGSSMGVGPLPPGPGWEASSALQGNNGVTPPPTEGGSAVYDTADQYVVMFGGVTVNGVVLSTTWTFTHENWSELQPIGGIAPPGRLGASMTYDAARQHVVLFGGCADASCTHDLNDTWTFVHGAWTNITATAGPAPPARDLAMMAYDGSDGYSLLIGGFASGTSTPLDDEWTLSGGLWSMASSSLAGPPARAGGALVYDPSLSETVLFGGDTPLGNLADTWSYAHGAWTPLTANLTVAPSARWQMGATYDSTDGSLLVLNGYNTGTFDQDLWSFEGSQWTRLSDGAGPDPSYAPVFVDDPIDGVVLYFSGVVSGPALLTSTLTYAHGNWTLLINPPGSPAPRTAPDLFALFVPALIFPLLFAIMLPLSNRAQRRRESLLAQGVDLAPGEVVRWIETPKPWNSNPGIWVFSTVMLVFPLIFLLPLIGEGLTVLGVILFLAFFGVIYGVTAFAVFRSSGRLLTRAVGVVSAGVIVRRSDSELRVAWSNLQPSIMRPQRDRYWFQFIYPGKEGAQGGFVVTFDQARAILSSPYAPPWILARPVSDALGLPPRDTMPRPAVPPPSPPTAAPLRSTTVAPSTAPPPSPTWPPPATAYVPPPPPPVARPVAPSAPPPTMPARPPPGTTQCPRCGQYNPTGRVAFCRSCGQRLA